ncbi:MAG: helix-turn-helix domain-containing protein [Acidimicrobiia bacterium]
MIQQITRTDTANAILAAAKQALLEVGYARFSTRIIAERAGVPLSQIHYHFGSKQKLVLAILAEENQRLLDRQKGMFESEAPLWKQWEQACDFLEEDLASGYVRVLHELIAAGWSDTEIAEAVWGQLRGWHEILANVAKRAEEQLGGLGPFTAAEVGALAGLPFIGAEAYILLGVSESDVPARSALRKVGQIMRVFEEAAAVAG